MMKRIALCAVAAFWPAGIFAGEPASQPVTAEQSHPRPVAMEKAEQWTMRSKAGRIFEISLARPSGTAPEHGYPVMYVLDLAALAPYGLKGAAGGVSNETHNSVIPAYLSRGARFTLQGWFE
jgi:hypothetical protein